MPGPRPISHRVPTEFVTGRGIFDPGSSRRSRAILPSFAEQQSAITSIESVAVTIPIPAFSATGMATLTGTQGLTQAAALKLTSYDTANLIFANVSVAATPPANLVPGHPQIQLVTQQGNPISGLLQPGQSYTQMAIQVTIPVYAVTATSAASLQVTGTALVIGGVLGD